MTASTRINDAVQTTLQAFCPTPPCADPDRLEAQAQRQAALVRLMNQEAQTLDIRHRRDVALLDASFALMKNTSLLFHFQNTAKSGTQPWFASFGFAAATSCRAQWTTAPPTSARRSSGRMPGAS